MEHDTPSDEIPESPRQRSLKHTRCRRRDVYSESDEYVNKSTSRRVTA